MKEKLLLKNGNILYIMQDSEPQDPREWDNLGTMICWHSRYQLGDHKVSKEFRDTEHLFSHLAGFASEDIESEEISYKQAWKQVCEAAHKNAIILPLALIDHSGLSMWVGNGPSNFDPGGWDSGQIGWIYVTQEKIKEEYGKHGGRNDEEIIEYLTSEVKTYDQYLTGDCYGFNLVKPVTNTWVNKATGEEVIETTEEDVDSCWGFFGHDHKENGLYDQAGITPEDILEEETINN